MAREIDIFAEAKVRQEQLLNQLASCPVTDVLGVVGASGTSGLKFRNEELWTLKLTLEAWRMQTARLQTRPLTVRRMVTKEELARFRELIRPYTVIRIQARVIIDSSFGGPEGLLEAFGSIDGSDAELNDYVAQLQKPVNHVDSVLGTFTLDRRINWFAGSAVWNGKPISVHIKATEPADVQAALRTAHSLWEAQAVWTQRVCDYAVTALLPLKNESWLAEGEVAVTPNHFRQRMKLESVRVRPDGSFEFWHSDGDLFWGHSIQIRGSLSRGPTGADIPG
jgi:hypothetical protein